MNLMNSNNNIHYMNYLSTFPNCQRQSHSVRLRKNVINTFFIFSM